MSVSGGIPTAVASLPEDFQNLTEGLQGNYNGDDTDDFIFRNGTMLSNDANEQIIFEFGQSCKSLLSATAQECHVAKIHNTKLTMIILNPLQGKSRKHIQVDRMLFSQSHLTSNIFLLVKSPNSMTVSKSCNFVG